MCLSPCTDALPDDLCCLEEESHVLQAFGGMPGAMRVDATALVFTASWTVTPHPCGPCDTCYNCVARSITLAGCIQRLQGHSLRLVKCAHCCR